MALTKIECGKIAKQILQKKQDEFDIKLEELKKDLFIFFNNGTPKDILLSYNEYPKYFTDVYFRIEFCKSSFTLKVPSKKSHITHLIVETEKQHILKYKELEELYNKIKQAENALIEHLYKLRTIEKVILQFPDVEIEQKPKTTSVTLITPEFLDWIKK